VWSDFFKFRGHCHEQRAAAAYNSTPHKTRKPTIPEVYSLELKDISCASAEDAGNLGGGWGLKSLVVALKARVLSTLSLLQKQATQKNTLAGTHPARLGAKTTA